MTDSQDRREQLTVPLSADLRRAVEKAAQADDRPMASFVRRLIERSLAEREHQPEVAA